MSKKGVPHKDKHLGMSPKVAFDKGKTYIERRVAAKEPLLITELALALGVDRVTLLVWSKEPGPFGSAIKKLRSFVEAGYERRMFGQYPTGAIFALKNLGWHDDRPGLFGSGDPPLNVDKVEITVSNGNAQGNADKKAE